MTNIEEQKYRTAIRQHLAMASPAHAHQRVREQFSNYDEAVMDLQYKNSGLTCREILRRSAADVEFYQRCVDYLEEMFARRDAALEAVEGLRGLVTSAGNGGRV